MKEASRFKRSFMALVATGSIIAGDSQVRIPVVSVGQVNCEVSSSRVETQIPQQKGITELHIGTSKVIVDFRAHRRSVGLKQKHPETQVLADRMLIGNDGEVDGLMLREDRNIALIDISKHTGNTFVSQFCIE